MSAAALELKGIGHAFGERPVLRGVDLALTAGARLTVAGRSGGGKTTLLRIVAGLTAPEQGEVLLEGRPASGPGRVLLPPWQRGVQLVFQNLGLWPTRTVLHNLSDALRAAGASRADARDRAAAALERVDLREHAARKPGSLSGGEARRLAFARALVLEPRVLLLDEPFSSLDPVAREQGFAFLEETLAETEAAVVLVTHDPGEARALGGHVAVLKHGELGQPQPAEVLCASEAEFRRALES